MNIEVVLNCMNKNDFSIIEESNLIDSRVLIVNQCGKNEFLVSDKHTLFCTKTRGLSVGRNIGKMLSSADICVISDDDEVFVSDFEKTVIKAYEEYKKADVIVFKITNFIEKFKGKPRKLNRFDTLKISSQQITFKRESVKDIFFDPKLGAGTGNGAGEENKFLLDCIKKHKRIYYVPAEIAYVKEDSSSTWFQGYNTDYFYNRGKTTRYIYGLVFSFFYSFYFAFLKRKLYHKSISFFQALKFLIKGVFKNDIS